MEIRSGMKRALSIAALIAAYASLQGPGAYVQAASNPQSVFTEIAGWPIPPQYQGNPYASGGVGPAQVMFDNLIQGVRMSNASYFRLAQSIENTKTETIVHLRPNAKWSTGQPFTSKDVWALYTLDAEGQQLDHYITGIETPDAHTVVFKWIAPYPSNEFRLFFLEQAQMNIPYYYYKQYVDTAAAILSQAPKYHGGVANLSQNLMGHIMTPFLQKKWDTNWNAFTKHAPRLPICSGPYMVQRVTATDMLLVKNPYYWDSSSFSFKVLHYIQLSGSNGNEQYNLLSAGKIDRVDGTPPQDLLKSVLKSNPNIVHYKFMDPAVWGVEFNVNHPIMQKKAVRQAIIYAINRDKVRQISNVYGHTVDWAGVGMPPSQLNDYVPKSVQAKMTKYAYNPAKATKLLESVGWKKVDGVWEDASGKPVHLTIAADAGWTPQWLYAGEAIAEQLTAFGIKTDFRTIPDSIYWGDLGKTSASSPDMAMNVVDVSWGNTNPWNSLTSTFNDYNWHVGLPEDSKGNLLIHVKGFDGKTVDPMVILREMPFIKDQKQFNYYVSELSYIVNENAWQMDIYQNTDGTFFNMAHVSGLPWQQGIKKYNRNLPVPPAKYANQIYLLEEGFSGEMMYTEIKPS